MSQQPSEEKRKGKTRDILGAVVIVLFCITICYAWGSFYAKKECRKNGYTGESAGVGLDFSLHCASGISLDAARESAKGKYGDWTILDDMTKDVGEITVLANRPLLRFNNFNFPDRTFGGYDCTDDCSGHEAGYEWAEDKDINDIDDCGGNSNSFIEGCWAYVDENY